MNTTSTPEENITRIRRLKAASTERGYILKEVCLPTEEFDALKDYLQLDRPTFHFNPDPVRTDLDFEGISVVGHANFNLSCLIEELPSQLGALEDWANSHTNPAPKLVTDEAWRKNAETLAGINKTLVDAGVRKDNAIRALSADVARLNIETGFFNAATKQFVRDVEYYRGLLDQIAVMLGHDTLVCDDGTLSDGPLRDKLPEVLTKKLLRLWELEAWQERQVNCASEPLVAESKFVPPSHVENGLIGLIPRVGSVWSFEDDVFTVNNVDSTRVSFNDNDDWAPLQCFFEIYTPHTL